MPNKITDHRYSQSYVFAHSLHVTINEAARILFNANRSRAAEHYVLLGLQAEAAGIKLESAQREQSGA